MKKLINKKDIYLLTDIAYSILSSEKDHRNSKERLLRELDELGNNRDFFVKIKNKKPLAMIQLIYRNADNDPELANGTNIAHIHDLEVRKEMQNQGIGREVVKFIELYAKEHKITILTLGVDSFNIIAIKLYESMGYIKFKEEEGRTADEKLYLLKKELK